MGENGEKDRRSRFTLQISIGDIITVLSTALAVSAFYFALKEDVSLVKRDVANLSKSLDQLREDVTEWERDVNQQIWELLRERSRKGSE